MKRPDESRAEREELKRLERRPRRRKTEDEEGSLASSTGSHKAGGGNWDGLS